MTSVVANGTAIGALLPHHLADLRKSGLSDATVRACGFHSLEAKGHVRIALNWEKYSGALGACLAIPFHDRFGGRINGYLRLKPDRPLKDRKGKARKYESPKGQANRVYFVPGTSLALEDPQAPLLITEGEKKAAAATQEGFPCIGLVGVEGWSKPRGKDADGKAVGERLMKDELAELAWDGRPVFVCYDSDAVHKPEVRWAELHLAEALQKQGAVVKIVRLPDGDPGPDGKPVKMGLDDFLVARGPAALRELLPKAEDPAPPRRDRGPGFVNEAPNDPHRLARVFLHGWQSDLLRHNVPLPAPRYRYWQGEFYQYDKDRGVYRRSSAEEMRSLVSADAKEELDRVHVDEALHAGEDDKPASAIPVSKRLIGDVLQALGGLTLLPATVQPPAWIGDRRPHRADEMLITGNGLVHLPSVIRGRPVVLPHGLDFFALNSLDYNFDPDAAAPRQWLEFLSQLWPDDPDAIATLQEWFGYCLLPDTRQQKILLIVGPKRSGKGTIARVLRAMVGIENTVAPTLAGLGTNFGLWPLVGKTVAVISDARMSGRTDAAIVTERLLAISGEDAQTIDRKSLSQVTAKLAVRFMVLTNELPRLTDASGALVGRMIVLRQTRSWYGKEDTALSEKLIAELPGVLLWAVEGYRRLHQRGYFVQPESSRKMIDDLEDLSSPVGAFLRECCEVGPNAEQFVHELYEGWKEWCTKIGRDPGSEQMLGRDLRAVLPGLDTRQHRFHGRVYRKFIGLRLRDKDETEVKFT